MKVTPKCLIESNAFTLGNMLGELLDDPQETPIMSRLGFVQVPLFVKKSVKFGISISLNLGSCMCQSQHVDCSLGTGSCKPIE
jgi:hypothetical protein